MISIFNRKNDKLNILFILTLIFNIMLPKAGLKVGGIPLTLGNIFFALLFLEALLTKKLGNVKFHVFDFVFLIAVVFWLVRLLAASFFGEESLNSIIGYLIPLCVYPFIFYLVPCFIKEKAQLEQVAKLIRISFAVITVYTVLQYFLGIGRIDIPGITVNYTDYKANPTSWWLEKMNAVGSASKMVSTYQNGNILGAAIIMFFPFIISSSEGIFKKAAYFCLLSVNILLAGSRTMYVGLFIIILFYVIKFLKRMKFSATKLAIGAFLFLVALIGGVFLLKRMSSDFFDRILSVFNIDVLINGTGRTPGVINYLKWSFTEPLSVFFGGIGYKYDGFAYEMTYFCVLLLGGIFGLALYVYPIFKILSLVSKGKREFKNDLLIYGAFWGIAIYLIVAFVEGAYWLPPTALNFWFMLGFALTAVNLNKKIIN